MKKFYHAALIKVSIENEKDTVKLTVGKNRETSGAVAWPKMHYCKQFFVITKNLHAFLILHNSSLCVCVQFGHTCKHNKQVGERRRLRKVNKTPRKIKAEIVPITPKLY